MHYFSSILLSFFPSSTSCLISPLRQNLLKLYIASFFPRTAFRAKSRIFRNSFLTKEQKGKFNLYKVSIFCGSNVFKCGILLSSYIKFYKISFVKIEKIFPCILLKSIRFLFGNHFLFCWPPNPNKINVRVLRLLICVLDLCFSKNSLFLRYRWQFLNFETY